MNSLSIFSRGSADKSQTRRRVLALVDPEPLRGGGGRSSGAGRLQNPGGCRSRDRRDPPDGEHADRAWVGQSSRPTHQARLARPSEPLSSICPGTPIIVMGCGSESFALEAVHAGARCHCRCPIRSGSRWRQSASCWPGGPIIRSARTKRSPRGDQHRWAMLVADAAAAALHARSLDSARSFADQPRRRDQTALFTARELDGVVGLQRGRSNKWIASRLNLSENTVKVHISGIMGGEGHEPHASGDLLARTCLVCAASRHLCGPVGGGHCPEADAGARTSAPQGLSRDKELARLP